LRIWLRSSLKGGLPVPWAYTRVVLAQRFHTTPLAIDGWPAGEVREVLRVLELEEEATAWRAQLERQGGRQGPGRR
jgi:hypothetical protein